MRLYYSIHVGIFSHPVESRAGYGKTEEGMRDWRSMACIQPDETSAKQKDRQMAVLLMMQLQLS